MKLKRKNKAHKSSGRRGRRYRKAQEGKTKLHSKISKSQKASKKVSTRQKPSTLPVLVSLVPLSTNSDCASVRSLILETCQDPQSMEVEASSQNGTDWVTLPGAHRRKWILLPTLKNPDPLETAKLFFITDLVLFIIPATNKLNSEMLSTLRLFKSCGVCSFAVIIQSKDSSCKKAITKELQTQFGVNVKVFCVVDVKDCVSMVQHLQPASLQLPHWRQERPSLFPHTLTHSIKDDKTCLLKIEGDLRHGNLSVHQVVLIAGFGCFQVEEVEDLKTREVWKPDPGLQEEILVENSPPEETPVEMEFEDGVGNEVKTVPKGTSAYQAAWIADIEPSSGEDVESYSDPEDIRETQSVQQNETVLLTDSDDISWNGEMETEQDLTVQEEKKKFADEVETPGDQAARVRFQHYRGLKSFRTSPWDPKIDLPLNYSRIFEFENFKHAMKRAKKEITESRKPYSIPAGSSISLVLKGVSVELAQAIEERMDAIRKGGKAPLMVVGLMKDETKMSVQHYRVMKNPDYSSSVHNKEKFLFLTPLHCFFAFPLFSTDNPQYDKHKMEKTLEDSEQLIASTYGPITFPPIPLLAFKVLMNFQTSPQLAFTGTLQSCAPERIILKHIIFTGRPAKAFKKQAVVKGMFHNAEDVRWFKPLELWTKCGRSGYIKESLGTKGHMKCSFDGNIQHHDTVCISLYKRVYPKWPEFIKYNLL